MLWKGSYTICLCFFSTVPVKRKSLSQEDTVQFGVNSNDIPHTSHIIDIDPVFGDIVIKLRSGTVSKKDIQYITTRYITNSNDQPPPIT